MTTNLRRTLVSLSILLALVVGIGAGILADRALFPVRSSRSTPQAQVPDFTLMRDAWNTIDRVYVDRSAIQSKALTYGAISGMVDALGDTGHSTFLSPDMVQDERQLTEGEYVGVGLEIQMQNGQVMIVAPMDGSPASKAGLRTGELILRVDSEDVLGLSIQQVVKRIMGPVNTNVILTVFNTENRTTRDVTLERARIKLRNVTWQEIPGTQLVDVRIAAFSQGVTRDLQSALAGIQNRNYRGIVLDMRNDPGGILDEAIGVASQFLASGNVLLEKNAAGVTTPVAVRGAGDATALPLVVLIDGGTASAAEIVSGALQDSMRGTLIGEKTFGTGTVLGVFPLPRGVAAPPGDRGVAHPERARHLAQGNRARRQGDPPHRCHARWSPIH